MDAHSPSPGTVRPAALAGSFYAAQPHELAQQVDAYLSEAAQGALPYFATCNRASAPRMLILPHAGYDFSAAMAARGYARLMPHLAQIARIVLLGPTHRVYAQAMVLPTATAFATPLGEVTIDGACVRALHEAPHVIGQESAHVAEHSLEVHLPFIQRLYQREWLHGVEPPGAMPRIVPLLVGDVDPGAVLEVLQGLWRLTRTLFIISSDLSHFHPQEHARALDTQTCAHIVQLQPVLSHEQACGATALNAALALAQQHGLQTQMLGMYNSGDTPAGATPQMRERVVGYASFALQAAAPSAAPDGLSTAAHAPQMLRLARQALESALGGTEASTPPGPEQPSPHHRPPQATQPGVLDAPGACFVTLSKDGQLRGCIGSLTAHRTLREDIVQNAVAAATRDTRFCPVSAAELAQIHIEISVLSPAVFLPTWGEAHALLQLRPHEDGVILECQHNAQRFVSTYLPQVWQQLPQASGFLCSLKEKAGLPAQFWSEHVRLFTYAVQAFHEDTPQRTSPQEEKKEKEKEKGMTGGGGLT